MLLRAMAFVFLASAVLLHCVRLQPSASAGLAAWAGAAGFGLMALLRPRRLAWLLIPAAASLAWARAGPQSAAFSGPLAGDQARAVVVEGRVLWARQTHSGSLLFELDQLTALPAQLRVRASSSQHRLPQAGHFIQVQARARLRQGRLMLEHALWSPLTDRPAQPPPRLDRLRASLRSRIVQQLPPHDAGLARALLLGESFAAPEQQRTAYRQLGLLHLLCISGMHFWVWGGLLRRLLPLRMRFLRWPFLLGLGALANFSAPVLRAASALAIREWLATQGRSCVAWQLWSVALWLELGRSPGSPLGMLLSYSATAGLLLVPAPPHAGWMRRCLVPSAAAFLATAPILHTWQATLEPWSIPLTPLFALLLPFRLLGSALACLPGFHGFGAITLALTRGIEESALAALEHFPATPWALPQLAPIHVLLACCLALAALRMQGAWRLRLAVLVLALSVSNSRSQTKDRSAAWIFHPGNEAWLIATDPQGSVLLPLHPKPRTGAGPFAQVPLQQLARERAPTPWRLIDPTHQWLPVLRGLQARMETASHWQQDPQHGWKWRAWHGQRAAGASPSRKLLAWEFLHTNQAVLALLGTAPHELRELRSQLPPRNWSAVVLPASIPAHADFAIFLASLGKPPVFPAIGAPPRGNVSPSGD